MSPEECNVALINGENGRKIHAISIDKIATRKMFICMAKAKRGEQ
jgi:hypothetical protein